jgi:DNA polymerase elongation subunit (family B)
MAKPKMKARILLLDIETAPANVYTWGLFDQNIALNQVVHDGYMLSWSAKWLGEKKVYHDRLINYASHFKSFPRHDGLIAKSIWKLMDEADIIVGHNGDNFDIKWLNTVFLKNGLKPVSSFKTVDTYKEVKSSFRFLSNKLEFLVKKLGIGEKMKHSGFDLWVKCMNGDRKAWDVMMKYDIIDVKILETLYLELRPFMKHHPNLALYEADNGRMKCPNCGGSDLYCKGFAYTNVSKFQRYICNDCGKNSRGSVNLLMNKVTRNVI